jgi:hypothetical protein
VAPHVISLPRNKWGAFGKKADIERQAQPTAWVENDPKPFQKALPETGGVY